MLLAEEKDYLVKNFTGDFWLVYELSNILKKKDFKKVEYNGKKYTKEEILECIDYLLDMNAVKGYTEREEILCDFFGRTYDLYDDMVNKLLKILDFEDFWNLVK